MTESKEFQIIPSWARTAPSAAVIFDNRLRRYRAALLDGCFWWHEQAIGKSLIVQPFASRWISEPRWGNGAQPYFDLAFIDSDRVASCISLTRDSATNVADWLRNLQSGNHPVAIESMRIVLQIEPEPTESGAKYSIVKVNDFDFVSEEEFKAVREFAASDKYLKYEWLGVFQ